MSILPSQAEDSSLIRLEGAIDISSASDLKTALLCAFESGKRIVISVDDLSDLDVTAFQLLWAAQQEAARRGLKFMLEGQRPASMCRALAGAGLDKFAI